MEIVRNKNVLAKAQEHINGAVEAVLPYKPVFVLEGEEQEKKIKEISEELIADRVTLDTSGKSTAEVLKNHSWYINEKVRTTLDHFIEHGLTAEAIKMLIDKEYDNIIIGAVDEEQATEIMLGKLTA